VIAGDHRDGRKVLDRQMGGGAFGGVGDQGGQVAAASAQVTAQVVLAQGVLGRLGVGQGRVLRTGGKER